MKYVITLSLEATYEFPADDYDEEQAIDIAEEWFAQAKPHMAIQKLAPCQLGEACPYDPSHHCSDCR